MSWSPEKLDPEWPFDLLGTRFRLNPASTALVLVDMQTGYVRGSPLKPALRERYPNLAPYWNRRMADVVLPNAKRLIAFFRDAGLKLVYTRNGSLTSTGDEMTARLKAIDYPPRNFRGTPEHDIFPELAPRPEDLVVDKLTSGAFTASLLDHALRNMGVTDLVLAGFYTDMCVFGTARAAAELGYNALICEDVCGAMTQRAHDESLLMHARRFGRVATTNDVLDELAARERMAD